MKFSLIFFATFVVVLLLPQWGESARLMVSAAASLKYVFQKIERDFEKTHPEHQITLNVGSSGILKRQIENGAPVDVFASARSRLVDDLEKRGRVQSGLRFVMARNRLVLIAPRNTTIQSFSRLYDNFKGRFAIGNPRHVPAGFYAKEALESLGLWRSLSSNMVLGENVLQVLNYVALGEVDAGLVYKTDEAQGKGRVKLIAEVPSGNHPSVDYIIAILDGSRNLETAKKFVDFVLSPRAQTILAQTGFEPVLRPIKSNIKATNNEKIGNSAWFSAQLSILVALVSTFFVMIIGITIAYFLARRDFFGKNILHVFLTLPLVLPPTVTGYYLIRILGRNGFLGGPLYEWTGWNVTFTWWAAILASTVVSMPFMIQTGRAAIESVDRNVEYASQLLGKSEWVTIFTITIPLARRGLVAGLILSFARAMGEFGATLMLAGNVSGRTNTMPLEIYSAFLAGDLKNATWLVVAHTSISFVALFFASRWSRVRLNVEN